MKRIAFWSNRNMDEVIDNWSLDEAYPNVSEAELYDIAACINEDDRVGDMDDLKQADISEKIIAIGNTGRHDNKYHGYAYFDNLSDTLDFNGDTIADFYTDELNDFRVTFEDHDGYSYYIFREMKADLSAEQIENFEEKLYKGKATRKDITRYTKCVGDRIKKVYGI